jgi:hypothetical protein
MRRTTRLGRSIGLLKVGVASQTPSPYLCSVCKYQASFSTSATRAADKKTPFTEKIRQRIWGTDAPPGLEDPYGDGSVFDKTKKRAQEQKVENRQEKRKEERKAATPDMSTYEPAETWDGLEQVGGFENYWKEWDADHRFKGFLPAEVMKDSAEVTAALHRAMVEVLALQQAGNPLQDISKGFPGEDLTHEVQIRSSPTGVTLHFAEGASLEDIVQSLAPALDETAEKTNPTESEEDVAADRSSVDPLHPEAIPPTGTEETSTKEFPTESEEDVAADRSNEDPLHKSASTLTYDALVASWDPSWLQISLDNPEMKFAVSIASSPCSQLRLILYRYSNVPYS